MIYICKAFTLPCTCCREGCKALSVACSESCKCFGKLCDAISDFWRPITHSPLGGYVIGTWIAMILCIASFAYAFTQAKGNCGDARMYCAVSIGLSVVHIFGSRYVQYAIVKAIEKEGTAVSEATHMDIAKKAYHVALYDFGFCFYAIFFWAASGFNIYGMTLLDRCPAGPAWAGLGLTLTYAILVSMYFCCWSCCQGCCAGNEARKQAGKKDKTALPSAVQEGVPPQQVPPV